MVIVAARIVLHIPASHSLKDKRQVLRSLLAGVQHQFQLSVAEVDRQDQWQSAVVGLACVSSSASHADEVIARAIRFIESRFHEGEVLDIATEVMHPL